MGVTWIAEWKIALRRRRLFVLNVAIPLLLVGPLVAGAAPAHHAASVAAVLFVVFGVFGSAIPLVRDGEVGLTSRWLLAGLDGRHLLAGRLAAQGCLDLLVLTPATLLIVTSSTASSTRAASLLGALLVSLLVANAIGAWVAAAARSLAEAALFGAVMALLLLHAGGTFRTPLPGSWQAGLEAVIPFRLLHESLLTSFGATPPAAIEPAIGLLVASLFLLLTFAVGGRLVTRLAAGRGE